MVQLRFASLPDLEIERPVHRIGTVIDPVTRTFTVEVLFNNQDQNLKPNMLASMRIQDYSDDSALVVPSIILKEDFNGTFLFRINSSEGKTSAEKVYVKTGKTVQDITKIIEGINIDDQVIIAWYNLVSDGAAVLIKD